MENIETNKEELNTKGNKYNNRIIIALDEFESLRDRLDCATWTKLQELKVMGYVKKKDMDFLKGMAYYCIQSIDLSDCKTTILEEEAFSGCASLESIKLPNGIKSIPDDAFVECRNLELVYLPDTIESIGDFSFAYCEKIVEMNLPANVRYIGHNTFKGCTSMIRININSTTPPIVQTDTFIGLSDSCEFAVKKELVAAFLNDENWSKLRIVENDNKE